MNIHKKQLRGIKYQIGLDDWKEAKPSVRSYDEKKIIQCAYIMMLLCICVPNNMEGFNLNPFFFFVKFHILIIFGGECI